MGIKMKNLSQQIIKFNDNQNFRYDDFYVSKSNKHVLDFINQWPNWQKNFFNLSGERSSGKTHLMNIFIEKFKGIKLEAQLFDNIDIADDDQVKQIIKQLKTIYEDYWKKMNKINTSIKLPLLIKVKNSDNSKISSFEDTLNKMDLVNNLSISKFDKNFIFYRIIFNGSSTEFLKSMSYDNYFFNTEKKIWVLK